MRARIACCLGELWCLGCRVVFNHQACLWRINEQELITSWPKLATGREAHLGVWGQNYILVFFCCFISQNCKSPGNVLSVKNNKEYEKPIFTEHWTLQNNLQLLSDISKLTRKTLAVDWAISHRDSSASSPLPGWSCMSRRTRARSLWA